MRSEDTLVFSCAHADPHHSNDRALWLGKYIHDKKPKRVIDLGDGADMTSLNSFDTRRPAALVHQNYGEDIECYNDFQEKLRHAIKKSKRRRPHWIGFEGNHEHRIKKALEADPRLTAKPGSNYGVAYSHLQTKKWFDEYHEYENSGPAIARYGGVDFAHFFSSGNFGSATSGVNHALSVINNRHNSSVCGHSHKRNIYFKDGANSIGLVVGCYKGHEEGWAAQANKDWWHGVVLLKGMSNGMFEPEFISIEQLKKEYENET